MGNNDRKRRKLNSSAEKEKSSPFPSFMSGRQKLQIDDMKNNRPPTLQNNSGKKRRMGLARPSVKKSKSNDNVPSYVRKAFDVANKKDGGEDELPERLRGNDPKLLEMIEHEMLD